MKNIILIETASELISFANPNRVNGDKDPFLGNSAKLVFENDMIDVQLQGVEGFALSNKVKVDDIIKEMAKNVNLSVHIT